MEIIAHIRKHNDDLILGFGSFIYFSNNEIDADDSEHYCYHYIDDKNIESFFNPDEVKQIKKMKNGDQLIVKVKLSLFPKKEFKNLLSNDEIFNAFSEDEDELE